MNAEELLSEWESGEQNGMRAKRVQRLRDDLIEATGEAIPRRIPELEAFLSDQHWRGVITRKLREAVEGEESEE